MRYKLCEQGERHLGSRLSAGCVPRESLYSYVRRMAGIGRYIDVKAYRPISISPSHSFDAVACSRLWWFLSSAMLILQALRARSRLSDWKSSSASTREGFEQSEVNQHGYFEGLAVDHS